MMNSGSELKRSALSPIKGVHTRLNLLRCVRIYVGVGDSSNDDNRAATTGLPIPVRILVGIFITVWILSRLCPNRAPRAHINLD